MTPESQRIAIAEACGWFFHDGVAHWIHGRPPPLGKHEPLDYLNDLNAMHEVEKVMTDEQCERYEAFLNDPANIPDGNTPAADYVFHSTAAQRAEAFLRTLGLWQD
jgi:hypothetical protein